MPVTFTYEKNRTQITVYLASKSKEYLVESARQNGRSLNAEVNAIVEEKRKRDEMQERQTWSPVLERKG
ncbi:MAG TPA: Arc family DNA-binding protein [Ktedonobacteraceae bacterium]|jgi:hypothetical protein